eukprot:COSAG06_NODE_4243_length_4437_cov_333.188797_4_plen_188_part_00
MTYRDAQCYRRLLNDHNRFACVITQQHSRKLNNRFCDFLADPDSRSFSRFGTIIMQVAVYHANTHTRARVAWLAASHTLSQPQCAHLARAPPLAAAAAWRARGQSPPGARTRSGATLRRVPEIKMSRQTDTQAHVGQAGPTWIHRHTHVDTQMHTITEPRQSSYIMNMLYQCSSSCRQQTSDNTIPV